MATTTVRTGQPSGDTPVGMGDAQIRAVLSGLMLGLLLAALDQTIVSTALPTIVGELGGLNHLSWVVTAYLVTSTASTPLWGKISDLYGRKPMYIIAIVVFLAASALAGLSQSMWQLIATRGLQGIGGGGLLALTFAIVGDVIPPRDRGKYQGYFGAVFGLSSIAGPLLGGFFVDRLSWRWIFYINLPIGAIALFVISGVLHLRHQRRERTIDYLGAALLVAAVISGLLALVRGNELGWTNGEIVGLATAAVVLAVAFVWWEGRAPEPILPLRLFRNKTFSLVTAIGFMIGFALFGAIVFLPVYLQVVQRASPTKSALHRCSPGGW
jgi:EmrB/QacA subfamily drug resistance transporter